MDKNNNDNDRRNKTYSTFASFSRVCHSDPQNPGRMICKEVDNTNGEKNTKEFIYDRNGLQDLNKFGSEHNSMFSHIKELFNRRNNFSNEQITQRPNWDNQLNSSSIIPRHFEDFFGFNNPLFTEFTSFDIDNSFDNDLISLNDLFFNRNQSHLYNMGNQNMNNKKERQRPDTFHNYKVYDV